MGRVLSGLVFAMIGCEGGGPSLIGGPAEISPPVEDERADGLGPGMQEGIPAIVVPKDGACPEEYSTFDGTCVHERHRRRESSETLSEQVALFKRGAVPPIIGKTPGRERPRPEDLDPAALMASVEQLAERARARAEKMMHDRRSEAARRTPSAARSPESPSPGGPANDDGDAREDDLSEHLDMLRLLHNAKKTDELSDQDFDRMLEYLERHGKRLPDALER